MGNANFESLALSAYGPAYHYSEAQVQNWHIEDDGVLNLALADLGADNAFAMIITDSSTGFSSGYLQGYYVSLTTSSAGTYTSGNAQINPFAVDLFLKGTIACEAEGMYIYVAGSSPTAITSANICGLNVYIDDLGGTPSSKSCLTLHMADNSTTSGQDAFIVMRLESPGVVNAMFQIPGGTSGQPNYFLKTGNTGNMVRAITVGGTQDKVLTCHINGSTYWLPLYAASA